MGSVADAGSRMVRWCLHGFLKRSAALLPLAPRSRQPQPVIAMAMPRGTVADALSNLGGFDAWWEEQRQGAAQRPPDFAFEYLPPTQLSLTAQAAQSDPVRCGPLQFASTAPPPLVEYPDPPPAQLRAAAAAVPAAVPVAAVPGSSQKSGPSQKHSPIWPQHVWAVVMVEHSWSGGWHEPPQSCAVHSQAAGQVASSQYSQHLTPQQRGVQSQ